MESMSKVKRQIFKTAFIKLQKRKKGNQFLGRIVSTAFGRGVVKKIECYSNKKRFWVSLDSDIKSDKLNPFFRRDIVFFSKEYPHLSHFNTGINLPGPPGDIVQPLSLPVSPGKSGEPTQVCSMATPLFITPSHLGHPPNILIFT